MAEKFEAQVNDLSPYKEKYESMVDARKQKILEKFPEDKRENFKDKELDVLEFMADNLSIGVTKEVPARGQIKPPIIDKPYSEMTERERRQWHSQMVSGQ